MSGGYSYYSNNYNTGGTYGNSYYNNNAQNKAQEPSGGWSKGTQKGPDVLESGGWGKKPPATGTFSSSSFGGGSTFGTNKTFGKAGTSSFGSGATSFNAKGGFGMTYGANKTVVKQQHVNVPIKTLGLRFQSMKKEESGRKAYTVFHINMIEMFSQYTSDELRYYDYLSTDQIQPLSTTSQGQASSFATKTTGSQQTYGFNKDKKEDKIINHPTQWWEIPDKQWKQIKEPDEVINRDVLFYKQPYLDLPAQKFDGAVSKSKTEAELPPNTRIKLKGFKTSDATFSSHLDSISLDQNLTSYDPSFQNDDFKFRYPFSMTPTTRTSNRSGKSKKTFFHTTSTKVTISRNSSESFSNSSSNSSGLSFIPDIINLDQKIVSNLNIMKDGVKLIFPFEIDCEKLDPKNSVHIDSKLQDETREIIDEKGKPKNVTIKIKVIKISVDAKTDLDMSSPSIIFYVIDNPPNDHFYIRCNETDKVEHFGSIVNEYMPSLDCYPVEISYENKSSP